MRKFYDSVMMNPTTFEAVYSIRQGIPGGGHSLIFSQPYDSKSKPLELLEKLTIINKFLRKMGKPYLTGDEIKNFIDPTNIIEYEEYTIDELAKVAGVN